MPNIQALSAPIVKAYKAGGYGLVFVFVGTMLLLLALFFGKGALGYVVGVVGAFMILAVLGLFYIQDIKKLRDVNNTIRRNQEPIDTVQETAIQMTDLAYTLQALAFKNAEEIAVAVTQVRKTVKDATAIPVLSNIPGIERIVRITDNDFIVRADDLSKSIVATTIATKAV